MRIGQRLTRILRAGGRLEFLHGSGWQEMAEGLQERRDSHGLVACARLTLPRVAGASQIGSWRR